MTAQLPFNNPSMRIRQLGYADQVVSDDEIAFSLKTRRRSQVTTWAQSIESVYKSVQYDVIGPSDTSVSVNKIIQYSVLAPVDTSISTNKMAQYAVLLPKDTSLTVNKTIVYAVLEAPPLPKTTDVYKRFAKFFQKQTQPVQRRSKGIPLKNRLYVFTIT